MKTGNKFLGCLLIFLHIFYILPISTLALSDEGVIKKNELLTEYNNSKADIESNIDSIINYVNTYKQELTDLISVNLAADLLDDFNNRDKESFINHIIDAIPNGTPMSNDLKALKPNIVDLFDTLIIHLDDVIDFVKTEQYNIKVSDVFNPINDSIDLGMKGLRLVDLLNQILDNSVLGDLNIDELLIAEFNTEINKIKTKIIEIVNNQTTILINRLDSIKNNASYTNHDKVSEITAIIDYMENVENVSLNHFTTARNQITTSTLINYYNEIKTYLTQEMKDIIIVAKKYLVDEMTASIIENDLGNEEAINEYIVPVYGVNVTPLNNVVLIPTSRYLVSYDLINDINNLTNILSTNNGTFRYENLVSGRVATGSTIVVNNGTEDVLTYTLIVKGDLLGRGNTDTTDLFRLIDSALGTNPLTGIYRNAGDMNDDNNNDISDIINLIDSILGN